MKGLVSGLHLYGSFLFLGVSQSKNNGMCFSVSRLYCHPLLLLSRACRRKSKNGYSMFSKILRCYSKWNPLPQGCHYKFLEGHQRHLKVLMSSMQNCWNINKTFWQVFGIWKTAAFFTNEHLTTRMVVTFANATKTLLQNNQFPTWCINAVSIQSDGH